MRSRAKKYREPEANDQTDPVCRTVLHTSRKWQTRLKHSAFLFWKNLVQQAPKGVQTLSKYRLKQSF